MSDDSRDDDYEVGYGKPPKSTQFRKGRSGNPAGRPKGAKGLRASLRQELDTEITVQEGSRKVRITKAQAMAKQLMNKALKGDLKALMALLRLDPELYGSVGIQFEAEATRSEQALEPVDYDILRDFLSGPMAEQGDGASGRGLSEEDELEGRTGDNREQADEIT